MGRSKHGRVASIALALAVGSAIIVSPAVAVADDGNGLAPSPQQTTASGGGSAGRPGAPTLPLRRVVRQGTGVTSLAGAPAASPPLVALLAFVRRQIALAPVR